MDKYLRILAVLSSAILMVGFVWYRSASVSSGEDLSNTKVLPSSKIGTAIEMYSPDLPVKEPETPTYSHPPGGWTPDDSSSFQGTDLPPGALMHSSKSGRIVPAPTPEKPLLTPSPSPSQTPFEILRGEAVMQSSKSAQMVRYVPREEMPDLFPSPTPSASATP